MKRHLTNAIPIILIALISSCQNKDQPGTNRTDEDGLKQGLWVQYYLPDSTQVKSEVVYKDDNKVGEEKAYFQDGMIKSLMTWETDSLGSYLQGPYYQFYPNGRFMEESYYSKGIPDSIMKTYYEDGTIQMRAFYQNGLKTGKWVIYNPSGKPMLTIEFKEFQPEWMEDTRTGLYTYLAEDSIPTYRATWLFDNLVSDTILNRSHYDSLVSQGIIAPPMP